MTDDEDETAKIVLSLTDLEKIILVQVSGVCAIDLSDRCKWGAGTTPALEALRNVGCFERVGPSGKIQATSYKITLLGFAAARLIAIDNGWTLKTNSWTKEMGREIVIPPPPPPPPPEEKERVNHPSHYGGENNPYEAIKVIEAWELGFCLGNTVKYISRAGKKDGSLALEDLKKASWYLLRAIEQETAKKP